jgi:membrane-anchored mycosin MYCP
VTVAIIDSGVDANPQFGHRVIAGPDLTDPASARHGVPRNADCLGHGTAVASIIAAAPVPGIEFTGVAPAARILSVKVSNTYTFPVTVTPQAIRNAVALGATVINLSLASPEDVPALRSAVEFALHRNVVVVAAAGNDTRQGGPGPYFPAAYPGVLAVGAVGPDGTLAGFSSRLTPVAVTAPGVNVTSAYPGTFPDAYDPVQNGTSFAAAFVSGVVALVRSAHPRLTAAQVVARIEATADGAAGPGTGHGLVDPVRAVTAVLPAEFSSADTAAGARPAGRASGPGPGGQARHQGIASAGLSARAVTVAVIAGSFGLVIFVAAAVLAVTAARRRRRSGLAGFGRHRAERHRDGRVAHRVRLAARLVRREHGQVGGERLGRHEPGVRADRVGDRAVGAEGQPDPVGYGQACVPAGLLHHPDHVAGGAFGRQLRRHPQVQRDQPGLPG